MVVYRIDANLEEDRDGCVKQSGWML